MKVVRYTKNDGSQPFGEWLSNFRDMQARIAIRRRIDRLAMGNTGNSKALRGGLCELKIEMGPGYRIYFGNHGQTVVVLLCGGDKRSQDSDIVLAAQYWDDWKQRQKDTL